MTAPLGKLDPETFERVIAPRLGAARPEVLRGPGAGSDAAIVRIGAGRVMAITTDPLSVIPRLGLAESARLSCQTIASDLWTSGIPPGYAAIDFNLPPAMTDADLATYWEAMSAEWARLEVAVVTGHTGRYEGCDYSIVGSGTLVGIGDEGRTVGPEFVAPGDRVIVTRDCAVEATGLAAHLFPGRLAGRLDEDGLARARARLAEASVVADCRAALRVGVRDRGVSALHDATEGGVLGGLFELACATRCDLRIERAKIPCSDEARAVGEVLGGDPYWMLSQGALIVTARPAHAKAVAAALADEGIAAAEVGEVVRGTGIVWLTERDGQVRAIKAAEPDPWWDAYGRAVREAWT